MPIAPLVRRAKVTMFASEAVRASALPLGASASLDHTSDAVGQQKASPGENRDGQGTTTIEQGSAQAQEGEGQDHRRPAVAEGWRPRAGKSQEQLGGVQRRRNCASGSAVA